MTGAPQGEGEKPEKRQRPQKRYAVVRILRALKRRYHARKRHKEESHESNERMMARWTRNVGFFTALLVGVGLLSISVIWQQYREMQIEQRPWVYIDAPVITKPITKNTVGVWDVDLKFTIHNVGRLPATYVFPWVDSPIPVSDLGKAVDDYQRRQCTPGRKEPSSVTGDTIFPGQIVERYVKVGIWPKDWEDAWQKSGPIPETSIFRTRPHPIVAGCIAYQFPDDDTPHFTKFAYVVGRKQSDSGKLFHHDLSTIPVEDFVLDAFSGKGYFGAD